jgi:ubiquinone/menaquinone biosynthesis C-methylase UbiE
MTFDPQYTAAWYDTLGAGEWDRWERSAGSKVQYRLYLHHLRRIVQAGSRVLDAGCGAGRFTCELVKLGAEVVALDLSPKQLELCRERAPGALDYVLGSVTAMPQFPTASFDVVLALGGPLSYCFDQALAALMEMRRVAKPRGQLMASVMNTLGSLHGFLPGVLQVDAATNARILRTGELTRKTNEGHECQMYRLEGFRNLLEKAGFIDIDIQAPGWLASVHELELPPEDDPQWRFLLDAELEASRESPAAGTHLIGFARAPRA